LSAGCRCEEVVDNSNTVVPLDVFAVELLRSAVAIADLPQ